MPYNSFNLMDYKGVRIPYAPPKKEAAEMWLLSFIYGVYQSILGFIIFYIFIYFFTLYLVKI